MRWGVLILLGVFFVSFASAVIPDDCDSSMIAYWQFENNLLDSYGSHDGGAWTGSVSYGDLIHGSVTNRGANFLGTNKITILNAVDLSFSSAFTIEMWVQGSVPDVFFEKGEYKIEWIGVGPGVGIINATAGSSVVSSNNLNVDTPYHIAVVWDSSGSELRLYVDGVEKDSATLSGAADASGDLVIGDGFTGLIDELAIYDDDLSVSLIRAHRDLGNDGKDYCDASGAGGGSRTEAVFNIRGCTFEKDGVMVGVGEGRCSRDPLRGYFYCGENQEGPDGVGGGGGWNTTAAMGDDDFWSLGCSMGRDDYLTSDNVAFCCPPGGQGYFCNESEAGGTFRCDRRTGNCFAQDEQEPCNAIGCIWWNEECIPGISDLSCGDYNTSAECGIDVWNLGRIGIGTELCGTTFECNGETFSVPEDDCECKWYDTAPDGQKCQVKLIGVQMFYDPLVAPDRFECSNVYELGNCTEGEQSVNWTSNSTPLNGSFLASGTIPIDCLEGLNCNGGEGMRFCGEPIIKLPGFSLFAFFASLFIVGGYYIMKHEKI